MNSLFQQLERPQQTQQPQSQNNQRMSNKDLLKQMMNSGSNPQEIVQNMMMNNPKIKNIMNLFQGSQMTPKQFFYYYAQQQGIDPKQFINSLI